MVAEGARALGMGGVHASGLTALAVRDLADGAYGDAYALLKPFVDDPFLQVTPLEYPDFVEAAVRSDRRDDALPVVARLERDRGGQRLAVGAAGPPSAAARWSTTTTAERHFEAALEAFAPTGIDVEIGPHPSAVRRVAAPGAPPAGRPRAPAPGRGDLHPVRGTRLRRRGPGASSTASGRRRPPGGPGRGAGADHRRS